MPNAPISRTAAAGLLAACSAATAAGADVTPLPSLSARHVTLHEPSGTMLREATIELSAAGLRVTRAGERGRREMIQDFVGERAWLVDRRRNVGEPDLDGVMATGETSIAGLNELAGEWRTADD